MHRTGHSVSLLAIAAMLVAMPVATRGQSFNATGTVVAGSAFITESAGQTLVQVNQPNAVINWVPNAPAGGGPIIFQPVGTTALFTNLDQPNYAVLNRILPADPARPVVFNGTVISQLQNPLTGAISRGGTLFFYSPGGILVGSTGVFNVGSLALTSSDLAYDSSSGAFGTAGTFNFLPANAGSSVEIRPGAQITAGPFASYVALVAPKVVNAGTITVDGSAVLVAADASTITFRPNGLFDIQIDQGTSATGEVVTNTGTITGSAGTINSSNRVYVVAVPRNDAITMAIKGGSTLGFDVAAAADVDGNAIVLSAGFDVADGEIVPTRSPGGGSGVTSLAIGAIDATSQVTGRATGRASLLVDAGNSSNFASNVSLSGVTDPGGEDDNGAFVSVSGIGSTLDISGTLLVTALDAGQVNSSASSDTGNARISVNRGILTVGGGVAVDASRAPQVGVDAAAGEASFTARNGSTVNIGVDLLLDAGATGKTISDVSSLGPNPGTGGTARLSFFGSGSEVTIGGNLALNATGLGGGATTNGYAATAGTGGLAEIDGLGGTGTLTVTGTTLLDSRGIGGDGLYCVSCTVEGGTGTGGTARLVAATGTRFDLGGAVSIDASAIGGNAVFDGGKAGGAAQGGSALVSSTGGVIAAGNGLTVQASADGGLGATTDTGVSGATGFGGDGGLATGGSASLSADAATLGAAITIVGDTVVSANGTGGFGGNGAEGAGGSASVTARHGSVVGQNLSVQAYGQGGNGASGGAGGAGGGGVAEILALSALAGGSTVTFGSTAISVRGTGGAGSTPSLVVGPGGASGAGGSGTGGLASVLAEAGNGVLTLAETFINANGGGGAGGVGSTGSSPIGGDGGAGGFGRGGSATIGVISGLDTGAVNTGSATLGLAGPSSSATVSLAANGTGGFGGAGGGGSVTGAGGSGGNGAGGEAALLVQGGAVNLQGLAEFRTNGTGGNGGSGTGGGAGGNATVGGDGGLLDTRGVRLVAGSRAGHADQQGQLNADDLNFSGVAFGGSGASQGTASVLGHPLTFQLDGAAINAASLGFFAAAGDAVPGADPSVISLVGGDTTLTGAFNFATQGTLTAAMAGADLFSDTATITASDWLSGAVPAGLVGTIHGTTSLSLTTGAALFGNFSVDTQGSLALTAGGRVRLDNLIAGGTIAVDSGSTIALGDLQAGSTVSVIGLGNTSVGNVGAGDFVSLSSGGAVSAGGITSGQSVQIDGATGIALSGNVVAGESITLGSGGAVSAQGLSAGLVSPSAVSGALYDVTVLGLGALTLGTVAAAHDIKLFTPQTVTTGALSGREIAVLASGAQSIASIAATGRVLLADYTMTSAGGDPLDAYDLEALFAAAPIMPGGPITVAGATSVGALSAWSTGAISFQGITTTPAGSANGNVELQAGGAISTGAIVSGGRIDANAGGTMDIVSANAASFHVLNATGAITTGALFGESGLTVTGLGAVTTGALGSGSASTISITSGSAMDLASVTSGDFAVLNAGGALTSGDILAQGDILVTGGDRVTLGAIRGPAGRARIQAANALQTDAIDVTDGISLTSTAGSVTAGNLVTGTGPFGLGRIAVTAGGAVSIGTMFAADGLTIAAGTDMVLGAASTNSGDFVLGAGGNITTSDLVTGAGRMLVTAGGSAVLGNVSANGLGSGIGLDVSTVGALVLGSAAVNLGELRLTSGGALTSGTLAAAGGPLTITSGGDVTLTGSSSAGGDVVFGVTGSLSAGSIGAGGRIGLNATGAIATGALASGAGGSIDVSAGGAMDLVSVASGNISVLGEHVNLTAGGAMTVGAISSFGDLVVTGGDRVSLGDISLGSGTATLSAANALTLRSIGASNGIALASTTGNVTAGDLVTGGTIVVDAGGAVSAGRLNSFGGLSIAAGTNLTLVSASSDLLDLVLTAGGDITSGNLGVLDGKLVVTAGGSANLGNLEVIGLTSGLGLDVSTGGALGLGSVSVNTGELRLTSGGALTAGALTARSGPITITAAGDTTLSGPVSSATGDVVLGVTGALAMRGVSAAGRIELTATGAITTDALDATGALDVTGTALTLGDLAGSTVTVGAGTTLSTGSVTARTGAAVLGAAGALVAGDVSASGAVDLSSTGGDVAAGSLTSTGGAISLTARGAGSAGVVTAASGIAMSARSTLGLTSATSAAGDVVLDATTDLTTGDLAATGGRLLVSAGGAATLGDLSAAGLAGSVGLRVSTGTALAMGDATASAGELRLVSGGAMTAGNLAANGGALNATSGGALGAGSVSGRDGVAVTASGDTTLTGATSSTAGNVTLAVTGALNGQAIGADAGLVDVQATTSVTTGALTAANALTVSTGGALVTGDMQGASVNATAGTSLRAGAVTATGGAAALTAANDLTAGNVSATAAVAVQSTSGAVTTGTASAGGNLAVLALGNLQTGALTAGARLNAGGSNVSLGNVRAETQLNVSAGGTLVTGLVESTQSEVQMSSTGAMRTGAITAAAAIQLGGQAAITTGDLTAGNAVLVRTEGDLATGAARSGSSTVELRSNAGSLTVGAVSAATDMALAAANDLVVGNVSARDMLLLAGGNVRTGSLTSPDGRILVASNTLVDDGGAIGEYNFNAVFAGALRATGGTLAVGGPVTAGAFTAALRGDAALLGVDASRTILVQSGGTVSLGGVMRAPQIELRSNDLVMPAGSGLNAGLTGTIRLNSGNANGMRIGDGLDTSVLPASSYTLDNAEWSRINSGSLSLFAIDGAGPVTILIGKLDVTGPDAGSTIDDPVGTVLFRTGESPTADPSGTIRVAGALEATGFRSGNALVFQTGQFQLAADTGSIAVLGQGDALAGTVRINARDIHVAATPLLARLAADPFFAGVEPALDTVSAGGNGPVLRAGALDLTVGRTFYIQRTGVGGDPLGFEEPLDGFKVSLAGAAPITVIINGTFRTASGLVSGVDAWRLFKDSGVDLSGFTAESRLNGCLLNAATCGVVPPLDPRPDLDPGFRTLVEVLEDPVIDDSPRGEPDDERERQTANAILPPQSVLAVQPDSLPTQIDEPIAGSGNPALIGAALGGGASQ